MNPFELITDDEVIYQMCQTWETPTLLNMSEVYKRVNDVCKGVIKKREIETIKDLVTDLGFNDELRLVYFYHKEYPNNKILIQKSYFSGKGYGFYQFVPISLPWVLSGMKNYEFVNGSRYAHLSDDKELLRAVQRLKRAGFIKKG